MRSERPKPLHLLCGRPKILHVLDAMAEIDVTRVVVVVGHRADWVTKTLVQAGTAVHGDRVRGAGDPVRHGGTRSPWG